MKKSLIILVLSIACITAHATTFTVTNTNDSGPGSLRAAMAAAQADANAPHTINVNLAPGTIITLTTTHAANEFPLNALPNLYNTTLNGNGVILKAQGNRGRFFQIYNSTVNNLTLDGGMGHTSAGAIFVSGPNNELNQCLIVNCLAGVASPGAGEGGALRASHGSTVTLNNCTIRNNQASRGSAMWIQSTATVFLNNCTISDNTVVPSSRGLTPASIFLEGTLHMTSSIIANSLPEGTVDLFDSGNTIETNVGNIIENFVCGGASCMGETFASTEDPGIIPSNSDNPYFTFSAPAGSAAASLGSGAVLAPSSGVTAVPTLGEWALICLALIMMIFGVVTLKERKLAIA